MNPAEVRRCAWHDLAKAPDYDAMSDDELIVHARNWESLCLYAWHPYMHNPQLKNWLGGVYQTELGRPLDDGGLSVYLNALNHGISRQFIARQIVLAHGGKIGVRSAERDGTTFTVALPSEAGQRSGAATVAVASAQGAGGRLVPGRSAL